MALGPSLFLATVEDVRPSWSQIGAGASLELSVGAKASSSVVLGGRLNATAFPYFHGILGKKYTPSEVHFDASLLTLLGPFADIEVRRWGTRSLHIEAGLSLAVLSLGPATTAFTTPARNLFGGALDAGVRWEATCTERWCLGIGGRVVLGRVSASDVRSVSTDDASGDRSELLFSPTALLSAVYR